VWYFHFNQSHLDPSFSLGIAVYFSRATVFFWRLITNSNSRHIYTAVSRFATITGSLCKSYQTMLQSTATANAGIKSFGHGADTEYLRYVRYSVACSSSSSAFGIDCPDQMNWYLCRTICLGVAILQTLWCNRLHWNQLTQILHDRHLEYLMLSLWETFLQNNHLPELFLYHDGAICIVFDSLQLFLLFRFAFCSVGNRVVTMYG
jgi:hypothetical protein